VPIPGPRIPGLGHDAQDSRVLGIVKTNNVQNKCVICMSQKFVLGSWVASSISTRVLQVNHWLLAYADEPRTRLVEVDD
jgi:hypothetical protein